jgi:hypothetical protein
MRVKLQYSVELDEVPEIVAELIEDEGARLSYCDHTINTVCDALRQEDPNLTFVIKKLDSVRQSLGSLDTRLSEMEGLLTGYEAAVNPPAPQPVVAAAPQAAPTSGKVDPETGVYNYEAPYSVPEDSE